MDRKPLYAQFDGDEVDGNVYALGDPLHNDTDPGTVAYLTSIGRFASSRPGENTSIPDGANMRETKDMSRAEMLAELSNSTDDAKLREAVEQKRAQEADQLAAEQRRDEDPLSGNADAAIDHVNGLTSVENLTSAKERETAGKKRTTVLAAIDKRVEALNAG